MPLYTIMCPDDVLDDAGREALAGAVTRYHVGLAGVPANWVHVVFEEFRPGRAFTAGRPDAVVALTLIIRTGRSPDYKRAMLQELWRILQEATGASDEQIVIGIQEVPPSQAMEMAMVMPEVAEN